MGFSMRTEDHNQKDNQQKSSGSSGDQRSVVGKKLKDNICMIAFVRVAVLIWSAGMLTLGYMGALNKMDPTFVAAVFTSTLSTFGIDAQRKREEELSISSNSKKPVSRNTNTP
jgi:hypothetical protein